MMPKNNMGQIVRRNKMVPIIESVVKDDMFFDKFCVEINQKLCAFHVRHDVWCVLFKMSQLIF